MKPSYMMEEELITPIPIEVQQPMKKYKRVTEFDTISSLDLEDS